MKNILYLLIIVSLTSYLTIGCSNKSQPNDNNSIETTELVEVDPEIKFSVNQPKSRIIEEIYKRRLSIKINTDIFDRENQISTRVKPWMSGRLQTCIQNRFDEIKNYRMNKNYATLEDLEQLYFSNMEAAANSDMLVKVAASYMDKTPYPKVGRYEELGEYKYSAELLDINETHEILFAPVLSGNRKPTGDWYYEVERVIKN